MGNLNINLEDYESRLKNLSELVNRMSVMNWTVENASQFCKEQGMIDKGVNVPQSKDLIAILNKLNNFDYSTIKGKILISQQQLQNLLSVKFDNYNEAYQNYINNVYLEKLVL